MKKIITSLLSLTLLLAMSSNSNAQCIRQVNEVTNPDFSLGNTGFVSSVPFNPTLCTSNGYIVADNFQDKCGSWPNVGDHTTGTGLFMIIDGPTGGGPHNVWSQNVNVCTGITYTYTYWAYNIYAVSPFSLSFVINGVVTTPANLVAGAWTMYTTTWTSGVTGSIPIALQIANGGSNRDFGIDDIYFGYCDNLVVSPPTSICAGGSSVLTASGAVTYSWSTGATTPSITVSPAVTTSYTVTGSDAAGCIVYGPLVTTVSVTTVNVSVTPPATICQGSCLTLTATGASTYSWSPGGFTGSAITVCPGVNTTYTVTGTAGPGCTGTATVPVSVLASPTVTATASPSTLTPPTATSSFLTSTVSGGSGFIYSWSPAATLSNSTIPNPVATPTTTTVYTLTVTNASGCTGTATVLVTVAPQSLCTLPYSYVISGGTASAAFPSMSGVTGQNISISGVFTVDVSFNFGGCNIVMAPGSRIEVNPGVLLLITNRTHIFTCDGMWDGINLQNGSSAQIVNASIIEDAMAAVTINQGSTAVVSHSIFNRNYTAVKLTANTSATSPLAMTGCVVTSRDLGLVPNTLLNPLASTAWTNIVAALYPSINMKAPFFSYRSIYGVLATDVTALQVGSDVSAPLFNGFDNVMAAGIHVTRTNAIVYNNKFRSITSTTNCFACTSLMGAGVYGVGSTTAAYSIKVGGVPANQPNDFYNVNTSIDIVQYTITGVLRNTIFNTSSTTALFGGYGKVGVRITPAKDNTVNASQNTITNCATGLIVNRNNPTASQTTSLTIDNNEVVANASGFCNTAISVTDPVSGVTLIPTVSEINFNTIIEAGTCINLANVKSKNLVFYNSCMTRYAAGGSLNGIKLVNCQNQTVQRNHTKYNTGTAGTNILAYGIFLQNSPANLILCNTIEDATRSLVFSGNCVATHGIKQNTMRRAQDGLVMLTTATDIGVQGTSASPSNNYWDMTFPMGTQIVSSATAGVILWYDGPSTGSQAVQPTTWSGGGLVLAFAATAGSAPAPCGSVPARLAGPEETQEAPAAEMASPLMVFPNPNNGQFTINANSSEPKDVLVYDMTGRLVFSLSQTTETLIPVDISGEAKGLYVVNVITGGEIQSARISNQ